MSFKKFNTYVIENGVIGEGEGERRRESKRDWSSRQKETREPKKNQEKKKEVEKHPFSPGEKKEVECDNRACDADSSISVTLAGRGRGAAQNINVFPLDIE